MKRLLDVLILLALAASPAAADVLHLKNGRTMEGTVVARHKASVTLKVPGGKLKIPRHTIARIEVRLTPQDEYAHRAATTDMSDPKAVEALALWASRRGLGEQAKQLRKMAKGLELQRRVEALRAKDHPSADAWLALSVWAKQHGHSTEVERYLLGKALEVDPDHEGARLAQQRLDRAERRRAARERARRHPPRRPADRARPKARRDDREATPGPRRLKQLERELRKQRDETQVLRDRLLRLERERQEQLRERRGQRIRNLRRHRRRSWRSRYRGRYLPPRPATPYGEAPPPPPPPRPRRESPYYVRTR